MSYSKNMMPERRPDGLATPAARRHGMPGNVRFVRSGSAS